MSRWTSTRLGDVLELKRGYDLPQRERRPGAHPIISSSGRTGWHNQAMAKGPGVVTGRYGTIGQVFFVEQDYWPLNTTLYVSDFKGNDPRFLSYLLRALNFDAYSDKGAVPGVNRNHLHDAVVLLPPVEDQRRIADTLATLDDKIEQNRRMSQTLEAIAQAIFKSWFVDFETTVHTTHAAPGASAGWRHSTVGDLCELDAQSWTAKSRPVTVHYVDLSATRDGNIETVQVVSGDDIPSRARKVLRPGDTIVGTVRPGNRSFALIGPSSVPLTGSTGFAVLSPKKPIYAEFVYLATTSKDNIERLAHLADGAAYPAIRPAVVAATPVVVPDDMALAAFHEQVAPLFRSWTRLGEQTRTLVSLRDSLLPKLLSGELAVPSAP